MIEKRIFKDSASGTTFEANLAEIERAEFIYNSLPAAYSDAGTSSQGLSFSSWTSQSQRFFLGLARSFPF